MISFVLFFLVSLADLSLQAGWSYNDETRWPGVCTIGRQQSPINIQTQSAVVDEQKVHIKGPLEYRGYRNVKVQGANNGHTLIWNAASGDTPPVLSGGPLYGNYTFAQFHFHWLSEHAIDGMKYPLEIHLVHVQSGLTIQQALKESDGLAVIGIFAMVSNDYNAGRALEQIISDVPYLFNQNQNKTKETYIDLTRMFSPNPQSYYTYHGSLTTPDCQEAVTWLVMDHPIYITNEQYNAFFNVDVGTNYNYRSLQPMENGLVYRSVASCSAVLLPSFAGTFLSLLGCLSSQIRIAVKIGICAIIKAKRKLFSTSVIQECSKFN